MSGTPRLRFAPSPTGSLHLGNARTALFNWLVARKRRGSLILRIEDTDVEREVAGAEAAILDELSWLGLDWDEGPDRGGAFGPYRQSERGARYREAAERLVEAGSASFCFCETSREAPAAERARREVCPCGELAPAEARRRAASAPAAVRFRPASAGEERVVVRDRLRGEVAFGVGELGEPVLLRRDGRPTYNFAVVVDDAAMRITCVIRGDDHLSNTPLQLLLYRALGARPPEFAHVPMVRGPDGSRLSKRHGAVSLADYRRAGYPAEAIVNALALLGWAPAGGERALFGREELLGEFDLDRVGRAPAVFEPAKLDWISTQHLRGWPAARLGREVAARFVAEGGLPLEALEDTGWLEGLGALVHGDVATLEQARERCSVLFHDGGGPPPGLVSDASGARPVLEALARLSAERPPRDAAGWREIVAAVGEATGGRGRALYAPLRLAITGREAGPELDRLVPLIEAGARRYPTVASVAARARRALERLA